MLRSRSGSRAARSFVWVGFLLEVEELPLESVQHVDRRMPFDAFPRGHRRNGVGHPAVVVDRAIAKDLEILGGARRRSVGVGLVPGIDHADPVPRALGDAVHHRRLGDADRIEDRRYDVDDVMELVADAAGVRDAFGPGHHHAGARAAEMRGDLLDPAIGGVHRKRPGHGEVGIGFIGAPRRNHGQHLLHRESVAVEIGDLVRRAVHRAFGAHAVVAEDVDDQRVVEQAQLLDGFDDAADLVVAVGHVGGPDVDLAKVELLLVGRQRLPLGEEVRPGRKLGVRRHHAQLLLVCEDALADRVPAVVEQMHRADLVHPLLGRMVWRVRRARRVVDEPGPFRVGRGLRGDVLDAVIRHRGDQVPLALLAVVGVDRCRVAEQAARLPLVGVAADEAVKIAVALPDRPVGERSLRARLPDRHVVVLAEPGGGVSVLL